MFVVVIPTKVGIQGSDETRDPSSDIVPGGTRGDLWIPGRVSLARNDDPTAENVKLSSLR